MVALSLFILNVLVDPISSTFLKIFLGLVKKKKGGLRGVEALAPRIVRVKGWRSDEVYIV